LPPLQSRSADAVVMWEVIEHVWDVRGYCERIRAALKPGGVFLLSTPNYLRPGYREALEKGRSLGSIPPIHINFFTDVSLQKTLNACGFTKSYVTKRRLYKPSVSVRGAFDSLKNALHMVEPSTLIALASVD
jgi:SAM-dependent methyltransferase